MGNICTSNFQKQDHTQTAENMIKNIMWISATFHDNLQVYLINGHFKYQKGQALLIITTQSTYSNCEGIRQYCPDPQKLIQSISKGRKILTKCNTRPIGRISSNSQYQSIVVCTLPDYKSQQSQNYKLQFRSTIRQLTETYKQISIQLNPTSQFCNLPNQLLLWILFDELSNLKSNMEKKSLNLAKFELIKTQKCTLIEQQKDLILNGP